MKTRIQLFLVLLLALNTARAWAADEILTVAVFDFESKEDGLKDFGGKISALLNANLSTDPLISTVERAELEKALGEHELGLSGTVNPATAAKIGQLTGAKVLITGRAFKVESEVVMVAKIIGVETGRVFGEMIQGNPVRLTALSSNLAHQISATVAKQATNLVAKVETPEERLNRIVASAKGDKRPAISIKLSERHFGAPVIDPAAQTELAFILGKAGFTVVDEKSEKRADIEITGEAFSALALRRGNLISCRSRIEVKVQERTTGKILTQDRQTSVAIDIAEQIAAKSSLANAAAELAERLVPLLAK